MLEDLGVSKGQVVQWMAMLVVYMFEVIRNSIFLGASPSADLTGLATGGIVIDGSLVCALMMCAVASFRRKESMLFLAIQMGYALYALVQNVRVVMATRNTPRSESVIGLTCSVSMLTYTACLLAVRLLPPGVVAISREARRISIPSP